MVAEAGHKSWLRFEERGYPAIIAHAAGNSVEGAYSALDDGADVVEVDIWFRNKMFEARHERRMGPIPLLFEKWYLSRAPASPFTLTKLVDQLGGKVDIFLDFKTTHHASAAEVATLLASAPPGTRILASSQWWSVLRTLYDRLPEVALFYSVDVPAKLDLFRSVVTRDHRPAGISCRESLLSRAIVREMHDRGLRVVAWTVDDLARAAELADWGVDGITTHMVRETHTLFASVR